MAINSLSSASRGIAGLASGINTEETVKKLLAGTQSKIDKATQKKTVLQYKQSMYRDVSSKLKTLQTSFMSYTSKTNLLSSSFYNNMTATLRAPGTQSPAFSVTAGTNAQAGTYKLNSINQLATAYSLKTTQAISGKVEGKLNADVADNILYKYRGGDVPADATMRISVGNKVVSFEKAPELFGGKSSSEVAAIINQKFVDEGVGAEARFVNNKLTIYANNPDHFISISGNNSIDSIDDSLSMKMFGDDVGALSGKGTFSATINTANYQPKITVNLDGRQQDIHLSFKALQDFADGTDATGVAFAESLSKSLTQAFGTGVKAQMVGDTLKFTTGDSSKLVITGNNLSMGLFGMKSGVSNKLNSSMAIEDLHFGTELQGSRQSFSINGIDFSYSSGTSLSTIINDINSSKAGVKISYLEAEDKFVIQRSETGFTDETMIKFEQTEGNLMSAMFGVAGGSDLSTFAINQTMVGAAQADDSNYKNGGNYTFNVNGRNITFNIEPKAGNDPYTAEEFAKKLNQAFRKTYNTMADGTQSLEFKYDDATKQFSIVANDKNLVVKSAPYDKNSNPYSLGFAEDASTIITKGDTKLEDAGIKFGTDGKISVTIDGAASPIEITESEMRGKSLDEVAQLMQDKIVAAGQTGVTVKFDKNTAGFRIAGVDVPMKIEVEGGTNSEGTEKLFGRNELQLAQAAQAGFTNESHGTNAKVTVDGIDLERSSNTFDYAGMTITLNSLYNNDPTKPVEPTEIVVARDTKVVMEGIQEFLKAYNETVDELYKLFGADPTYKDYPPLSAEQKATMSENEIKNWEEKAKEGLLRSDNNIGRILDSMRSAMYTRPDGSPIAIYDLGIDTSFYSKDGNFEMSDASKLSAMLEKDPEAVMKLFAGPGGIMENLNNAINDAIKAGSSPGYLTREAGSSTLDTTSNLYKQIKEVDNQLVTLEKRYWNEYDRYWKQFNAMEQAIQKMNEQSSWLSNMGSGG